MTLAATVIRLENNEGGAVRRFGGQVKTRTERIIGNQVKLGLKNLRRLQPLEKCKIKLLPSFEQR